jgi:hypothetical protein
MADFEKESYKFPDEQPVEVDNDTSDFEIEIEDDTPAEDRGRQPMPKPIVEELEADELEEYSEKAKEKLKQLRKVWHDERREKETALREHNEAVALAKALLEENQKIKGILNSGEQEYVTAAQSAAQLELELAKKSYKEAYESGNTDGIVEAQEKMQMANLKLIRANNLKLPSLQEQQYDVQRLQERLQPRSAAPSPDEKALDWQSRNAWFGQNQEMTAAALGLHERLKSEGVEIGSDEYYATLDKTMRKRFSEFFGDSEEKKPARAKPSTVVAPAVRSTSSNKIKLTQSQVQLAKKLGLTLEQYAKAALQLENQHG